MMLLDDDYLHNSPDKHCICAMASLFLLLTLCSDEERKVSAHQEINACGIKFSTTLLRWSHPADINSTNQMSKAQHVYKHLRITAFICDSKPKPAATESRRVFCISYSGVGLHFCLWFLKTASLTLKCTLLCSTGTMKKRRDNIYSLAFGCVYSFAVGKSCLKGLSCLNELHFWESSTYKIYILSERNIQ